MQMGRDIAMFALGVMSTLMYKKYKEPLMKKIECASHTMMEKADRALDDMM